MLPLADSTPQEPAPPPLQEQLFPYRVEPARPALILIGIVAVVVLLATPPARPIAALLFSGPVAFLALQGARHGRGVRIQGGARGDQLTLPMSVSRRTLRVPLNQVQGWQITPREGLAIAYLVDREADPGEESRPPRLRLTVTATLADPGALAAALSVALPTPLPMPRAQLQTLIGMRRVRRILLWCAGLFIAIPTVAVIVFRGLFAAISFFR